MNKEKIKKVLEEKIKEAKEEKSMFGFTFLYSSFVNSKLLINDSSKINDDDILLLGLKHLYYGWYRKKGATYEQMISKLENEPTTFNKVWDIAYGDPEWMYTNFPGNYEDSLGKIYLSFDNNERFKFASTFLEKCIENKVNYSFKTSLSTRHDNFVIYFTEENFDDYINIIEQIKNEHSFKFNEPNILSIKYNPYIGIGSDRNVPRSYSIFVCGLFEDEFGKIGDIDLIQKNLDKIIDNVEKQAREFLLNSLETNKKGVKAK